MGSTTYHRCHHCFAGTIRRFPHAAAVRHCRLVRIRISGPVAVTKQFIDYLCKHRDESLTYRLRRISMMNQKVGGLYVQARFLCATTFCFFVTKRTDWIPPTRSERVGLSRRFSQRVTMRCTDPLNTTFCNRAAANASAQCRFRQ